MDINDLRINDTKAEGTWIAYGEEAEFLIASVESKAYQKALQKIGRKYPPHKVRTDPKTQIEIAKRAMAEALVLDFKGVQDQGKALKNTIENRLRILEVPALRNWISDQAQDIANFQNEGETADVDDLKSGT